MCIKKKTEFFFPLKILSWLYPCFCIQQVGKKSGDLNPAIGHINDQLMNEKAKQWTLLSSACTFHATAWSYEACRPIVDMQIPAGIQANPWTEKNACNNSAIYSKSIACCLKQIWGCNDKKKLMMPNSRILPAALTSQNMRSNSCVQTHQIFCPVWYLVEPLELFPTCQGQPG